MVAISKELFYEKIGPEINCCMVMHPWNKKCTNANLNLFLYFIPGVLYFYVPIYLLKFLYNYKKISKSYFKEFIKSYLRSIAYGNTMTVLFASSHCMLCNIFRRIHYSTAVGWPGFIAGLSLLFESADNRYLNTIIWSTMVIETVIRRLDFFKIIKLTKWTETLGFASASSLLMYLFARKRSDSKIIPPNLWFYQPKPISNNLCEEGCSHNRKNIITPCTEYIFNEFIKYFGAGIAISVVKNIFNLKFYINAENIKFGLLLGGYVGVYRVVVCGLFHIMKRTDAFYSILGGFAAGTVYAIKPTKSLFAIAIVTIIQIYCAKYITQRLSKKKRLILQQLLYMTCNGILFHSLIMATETAPNYFSKLTNTATRGYMTNMHKELINTYLLNK